jgi:CRISPR-associated exonuclease Cas4
VSGPETAGGTAANGETLAEILISAIEHYAYCPRQCALIHVEQTYDENLFTVRGRLAHKRADSDESTTEAGVRVLRGIPLWSEALGVRGRADIVEFRPEGPFPIEYKSGKHKSRPAELQLCAQGLCLEEMLGVPVTRGAIFLIGARRRVEVELNEELRSETKSVIRAVRGMLAEQQVPEAPNDARCPHCSLLNACLPWVVSEPARMRGLQGALFRPLRLTHESDA